MHQSDITELAKLAARFSLDANHLEPVAVMQGNACFLRIDDPGEHRMKTVDRCVLDECTKQTGSNPGSVTVWSDVHRVFDRGPVPRPVAVEADAPEADDPTVVALCDTADTLETVLPIATGDGRGWRGKMVYLHEYPVAGFDYSLQSANEFNALSYSFINLSVVIFISPYN